MARESYRFSLMPASPTKTVISTTATVDQITAELYKLQTTQTGVSVVHMTIELCSKLFAKAKEIGMMLELH
ncbi:unnamed protein product [Prunus armeniaca]|uniref:Uncharacterized protein n=1 Tax=Prunus armeniaca TaxID=36596 RepID=A0A6J5TRW2_PRUAR|nr:unnamed protein product [Prunus armeniaca]CAB4296540.1 unnamed protein product [Prunus armeniaca]